MNDLENLSQSKKDIFRSEGIEICTPIWKVRNCNYHNLSLYRAEIDLREYLVNEGLLKDIIITNFLSSASENPNIYRPIFNAIAEGLPKTIEDSEFGMGKISDYDLFHRIKSDAHYDTFSSLYNVEPSFLRKQWITIRSQIKTIQEHILARVILFPSKQYFMYCSIIIVLFILWRLQKVEMHNPNEPGYKEFIFVYTIDSFIVIFLLGLSIILYFLYDIYHFHYKRNHFFLFYEELRRLTWFLVFFLLIFLCTFFYIYGYIIPQILSTIV